MATHKPRFNERLYEFCINYELVVNGGALIAGYVPGIPSPQDEATLGWDARVPMPTFGQTFLLQYKIARRTTARAGANAKFWESTEASTGVSRCIGMSLARIRNISYFSTPPPTRSSRCIARLSSTRAAIW